MERTQVTFFDVVDYHIPKKPTKFSCTQLQRITSPYDTAVQSPTSYLNTNYSKAAKQCMSSLEAQNLNVTTFVQLETELDIQTVIPADDGGSVTFTAWQTLSIHHQRGEQQSGAYFAGHLKKESSDALCDPRKNLAYSHSFLGIGKSSRMEETDRTSEKMM